MEFISTMITTWFVVMSIYYLWVLCVGLMRLAIKLPAIVVFIILLPVMPFIVAYRNRVEHPIQAKVICWMWGILYVLFGIIATVDGHL